MICSLCCGEKRIKNIPCPENCPYLTPHLGYEKDRNGEKFASELRDNFGILDEESLKILTNILILVYSYVCGSMETLDMEILSGLEYARRRLSPITFPQEIPNFFGREIFAFLEREIKEGYAKQSRVASILDRLIRQVKKYKGERIHSNNFVKGLIAYMELYNPEIVSSIKEKKTSSLLDIE